jgi:hypothetical protein
MNAWLTPVQEQAIYIRAIKLRQSIVPSDIGAGLDALANEGAPAATHLLDSATVHDLSDTDVLAIFDAAVNVQLTTQGVYGDS